MAGSSAEDPFTVPPEVLKTLYKRWQRAQPSEFTVENGLLDTAQMLGQDAPGLSRRDCEGHTRVHEAFETFRSAHKHEPVSSGSAMLCYEVDALPGGLQLGKRRFSSDLHRFVTLSAYVSCLDSKDTARQTAPQGCHTP